VDILTVMPCDVGSECKNSTQRAGLLSGKCGLCRFSPTGPASGMKYWRPDSPSKHPLELAEKKQAVVDRVKALKERKLTVSKPKQKLLQQAARAEKVTERNFIHSTRNSGRVNRDGDHVVAGDITLDTKLQTKRTNPVVLMHELVKVGNDARGAGKRMGALCLRNMNGIGVVAMTEADFAWLIQGLANG
jgi:hypothetical protein